MADKISVFGSPVNLTCKSCRFSVELKTGVIGQWAGECRKLPPFPITVPSNRGIELRFQFPVCSEGMYCFSHEPKV